MIRHFSQVSGTTESSSSCQGVLCAHGLCFLMFLQEVECSALAYNSCLHWISKSARNERLGPFQYFLEYEYSPEQECDLLDSRECVGAFQRHYSPKYLIHQPFLTVFLFSLPHRPPQLLFIASGSSDLNMFLFMFWTKLAALARGKFWIRWDKDELFELIF